MSCSRNVRRAWPSARTTALALLLSGLVLVVGRVAEAQGGAQNPPPPTGPGQVKPIQGPPWPPPVTTPVTTPATTPATTPVPTTNPQTVPPQTPPPVGPTTTPTQTPVTTPATTPPVVPPVTVPAGVQVPPTGGEAAATLPVLDRFGYSFFTTARAAVDARRGIVRNPVQIVPPTTGTATDPGAPVPAPTNPAVATQLGPEAFGQSGMGLPSPDRYQLGPGDTLLVRYSNRYTAPQDVALTVDSLGYITVPVTGRRIVTRGMTVSQAEGVLRSEVARGLNRPTVVVTLKELRPISVTILGESYAPGSYQLPSTVTLFNALYASGGPADTGSLRRIQLKRANGFVREFDLYRLLLRADASQDVPLQPGDVVFIPPVESRVTVRGEVVRPAIYELKRGERLREALGFAGGAKPSGISQKVAVESLRPGMERVLVDADIANGGGNRPLYDGDTVEVYSIRPEVMNAVTVEGAVFTPRAYALSRGMRVKDLVENARGLLRTAYGSRADLTRLNDDGTTTLIRIDLASALKGDPSANVLLKADDKLRVYTTDEVSFLGTRKVTVTGAARNTGEFARPEGMTLRDLLIQIGGLAPEASTRQAFLQRTNPDGTPGELVVVDLERTLAGDAGQNPVLQDRDELIVRTVQEANYLPDQSITVEGAILKPGPYTLARGMRLRDALALAGNPLPSASKRAFLQRMNPDGTLGPLVKVDLDRAVQGDVAANIALQPGDKLMILTLREATFRAEESVRIAGAVQRPGTYYRAENMTVLDLLELAGGALPVAAESLEIAGAYQLEGAEFTRLSVADVLSGARNPVLKAGDVVTLPKRAGIEVQPRIVILSGEVAFPGPYMITGKDDRLSDLVKRAGGLRPKAFPQGGEFLRDPKLLFTATQDKLRPRIAETLALVAEDDYKRASAMADVDRLRIVFSQGTSDTAGLASFLGGGGRQTQAVQPGVAMDQALAKALSSEAVTRARTLTAGDLMPTGNMNVKIDRALRNPGGADDVILQDGDIITIPETPTTVTVTAAVVAPAAIIFEPGKDLRYYLDRAGGPTADADLSGILIVRATGELVRYRSGVRVQAGDNIVVPTKVMAMRLREREPFLKSAINGVATAGITLALIQSLSK